MWFLLVVNKQKWPQFFFKYILTQNIYFLKLKQTYVSCVVQDKKIAKRSLVSFYNDVGVMEN